MHKDSYRYCIIIIILLNRGEASVYFYPYLVGQLNLRGYLKEQHALIIPQ